VGCGHGFHRGGLVGLDQGLTRLFYDGDCGLCGGAVRFVARQDRSSAIRFAPLGGETFARLVPPPQREGLPDSLVVLTPGGHLLTQSEAVIHLLRRMGPGWGLVGAVLTWMPKAPRDWVYGLIARGRKRLRPCARHTYARDTRFEP